MEEKKANKSKKNRSSIIRVIISNYDMKGLKEIKVLYQKQGGVDTFNLETLIDIQNNKIIINSFRIKKREKFRFDFEINILEDKTSVDIVKIDSILGKEIRKYKISLKLKEKTSDIIVAEIEDLMEPQEDKTINSSQVRVNIRNKTSKTERKLLEEDLCKNYSQIARIPKEEIDSLKIYKIKRFLNYRSNLLMYFAQINNFICTPLKQENINQISQLSGVKTKLTPEVLDVITNYVYSKISTELTNRENQINNSIEKNNREIGDSFEFSKSNLNLIKDLEKENKPVNNKKIKNLKTENRELRRKKENLEKINQKLILKRSELSKYNCKESLKEDLIKIIEIFVELRHALMHYNYTYFENLFDNKENNKLKELLDINFFKYTKFIEEFKVENKTNYLDGDEKLSIVGKLRSMKKLYSYYNSLCSRKSGFNNFINSFFIEDGIEDSIFKKLINEDFEKEIERMKKKSNSEKNTKANLKRMENHFRNLSTAYFWDIHNSKKYKDLYNKRKNLIEIYNKEIDGIRNAHKITNINKELFDLKEEMEKITKNNSLFRLKYKLQIAYAFLIKEFKGDLNKFKNEFNPTDLVKIKEYLNKKEKYLNYMLPKEDKSFNLDNLEVKLKELQENSNNTHKNYLDIKNENNLFKFYILTYLMLPVEFKSDFLGFVKNHYYSIKNVDFLDESDDNLSNEEINKKLEELKDNSFFHKIRLFEKNIKNYEIIRYSISTNKDIINYFSLLGLDEKNLEYKSGEEIGIFNKNLILPVFKQYQNIFKLYNDIEIHALLKLDSNLEIALEKLKNTNKHSYIEFKNLIYLINESKDKNSLEKAFDNLIKIKNNEATNKEKKYILKKSEGGKIRNSIAHLDYEDLFEKLFNNTLELNNNIRKIIDFSQKNELDKIKLGMSFINDYYMKKERFIFNQRRLIAINDIEEEKVIDGKRKEQNKKNNETLKRYNLPINISNLNKIYETSIVLKNIGDGYDHIKNHPDLLKDIKYDNKSIFKLYENKKIKNEIDKEFIRDSSNLMGIYKERVTRKIKEEIIKRFTYNEEKILTISVYDENLKKVLEPFIFNFIKEEPEENKDSSDESKFKIIDQENLENKYFSYTFSDKTNKFILTPKIKYEKKEDKKEFKNKIYLNIGYLFKRTIVYNKKSVD